MLRVLPFAAVLACAPSDGAPVSGEPPLVAVNESVARGACDPQVFVDVDALPPALTRPPRVLGVETLASGDVVRHGPLKLWTGPFFMPTKAGARTGRTETFVRAAILPDHEVEGITLDNYDHMGIESPDNHYIGRLRAYRWLLDHHDPQAGGVRLVVDEVACGPRLLLPPIDPGTQRRVWLSTQAATTVTFARAPDTDQQMSVTLQPSADWRRGDGLWGLQPGVWTADGGAGEQVYTLNPSSPEFRRSVRAGAFTVTFERVEVGEGTRWDGTGRYAFASHRVPDVHVLVRVARDQTMEWAPSRSTRG